MKIMLCFQDPTKSLDVLLQIWIIYEILIDFQKWYYSLVDICKKKCGFLSAVALLDYSIAWFFTLKLLGYDTLHFWPIMCTVIWFDHFFPYIS
jgi:hypothetical protein